MRSSAWTRTSPLTMASTRAPSGSASPRLSTSWCPVNALPAHGVAESGIVRHGQEGAASAWSTPWSPPSSAVIRSASPSHVATWTRPPTTNVPRSRSVPLRERLLDAAQVEGVPHHEDHVVGARLDELADLVDL